MQIVSSRQALVRLAHGIARRVIAIVVVAICTAILHPTATAAQGSPSGILNGVVSDPGGGVLPGVTVVAVNVATGVTQQTVSGATGEWRLAGLPTGAYEIVFELDGFKRLARSGVMVEAAVTRSV